MKWVLVPLGDEPPKCGQRPSLRSTARCEQPEGHDRGHMGRTRGGYWKIWGATSSTPNPPAPARSASYSRSPRT